MIEQLTNFGRVVSGAENQLRSAVVSRTNVRDIGFVLHQNLGASKITKLEHTSVGVQEQVLRLDIPMANTLRMDIGKSTEKLVDIQLDLQDWHGGLHFIEEA